MPSNNPLVNNINAGAAQKMTVGQRYRIAAVSISAVDDPYNPGQKRPQVIITIPEGERFYVPAGVARKIAEAAPEDVSGLVGLLMECTEYYSNRLRRNIQSAVIVTD